MIMPGRAASVFLLAIAMMIAPPLFSAARAAEPLGGLDSSGWHQSYDPTVCASGVCPRPALPGPPATYDAEDYWDRIAPQVGDSRQRQTAAKEAIVRIYAKVGRVPGYGSGVAIRWGARKYVLTVKHGLPRGTAVTLIWVDGRRISGRVVYVSDTIDAALIEADLNSPAYELADRSPEIASRVVIVGFGTSGRWRAWQSQIRSYTAKEIFLNGSAQLGDSGGPVIDGRGRVVGVVWGTDGVETVATSCEAIQAWLHRIIPPSSRPSEAPASPPQGAPPTIAPTELAALRASLDQLSQRLDSLATSMESAQQRLAALKSRPGPAGPPGPKGDRGLPGATGPRGKTAAIEDLDEHELAMLARRLLPYLPPQAMEIRDGDLTFTQRRPLGQPLRIAVLGALEAHQQEWMEK